ncbi:MAG: hypothetical protein H0V36_04785 [Chloroflexi bacterium]|nr:hypothetical protein [Chloroflexota bacterium]
MTANRSLRFILVLWVVGFVVISCGPAIAGDGVGGTLVGGFIGLLLGSVLFVPWVVGVVILLVLIMITNPRRYPDDRYLPPR